MVITLIIVMDLVMSLGMVLQIVQEDFMETIEL